MDRTLFSLGRGCAALKAGFGFAFDRNLFISQYHNPPSGRFVSERREPRKERGRTDVRPLSENKALKVLLIACAGYSHPSFDAAPQTYAVESHTNTCASASQQHDQNTTFSLSRQSPVLGTKPRVALYCLSTYWLRCCAPKQLSWVSDSSVSRLFGGLSLAGQQRGHGNMV